MTSALLLKIIEVNTTIQSATCDENRKGIGGCSEACVLYVTTINRNAYRGTAAKYSQHILCIRGGASVESPPEWCNICPIVGCGHTDKIKFHCAA